MVKVDYEVLQPIITMEEAVEKQSFHPIFGKYTEKLKNTDNIKENLASCYAVIESDLRNGAQEHFYMEPNSCLAGISQYFLRQQAL